MKTRLMFALLVAINALPASAEIVVVTNPANQATRMLPEQVSQFFLGGSTIFTPLDQSKDAAIRKEFYEKVIKKTPAQVEAIWAKASFSGKGTAPKEFPNDAAVKKAVAAEPSALAYIDKASVDSTVKVLLVVP
ncbi:hypothetical protein H8K47_08630 [Undibacterium sp. CY7W]|uniref:Phosphate ABC transporter substrate-binding protein n=2 Tax=Undibacterium rugosum TaxID=2762291 RepID=A0A923I306_9BURK|nr:hypothetical protein [Undibacterium rugosum]